MLLLRPVITGYVCIDDDGPLQTLEQLAPKRKVEDDDDVMDDDDDDDMDVRETNKQWSTVVDSVSVRCASPDSYKSWPVAVAIFDASIFLYTNIFCVALHIYISRKTCS